MTVLRRALRLKFLPRMVSVVPTRTRIGVTRVIEGALLAFVRGAAGAAGAAASGASAHRARTMESRRRDMSLCYRPFPPPLEPAPFGLDTVTRSDRTGGRKRLRSVLPSEVLAFAAGRFLREEAETARTRTRR